MLEKRNGQIGLRDEGPLHELLIIEVKTGEGREKRLGPCVRCGVYPDRDRPYPDWTKPCPNHRPRVIEVETIEGTEKRLGPCVLCGAHPDRTQPYPHWTEPCPNNPIPPLDRCEWDDPGEQCGAEGAVLLDDDRWLCSRHAREAAAMEGVTDERVDADQE